MIYEILCDSERQLTFQTHLRGRRGRAILFALAPIAGYLLLITLWLTLAINHLPLWFGLRSLAREGLAGAAILSVVFYLLGYRLRTCVEATDQSVSIRNASWRSERTVELRYTDCTALILRANVRSLGADLRIVALRKSGDCLPIAEGDPHSGQMHELARKLARLSRLPFRDETFT